jgi:phosphoribosylamine--glycine ligase
MAAEGYPGPYERDRLIENTSAADQLTDVKVFHAGTTLRSEPGSGRTPRIVSDGGRVLTVTALGADLDQARSRAYEAVRTIRFPGGHYRRDIAEQAARERGGS